VLILGGLGMLGHKLWQRARARVDAFVTVRDAARARHVPLFDGPGRVIDGVDAERFETVDAAIARVSPHVIVNCIGLVKQRREAADPVKAIRVNALLPHLLHQAAAAAGARLIHISTDCVFDGVAGKYRETDLPNARDLYGRSKALGEPDGPGALTLRTSIIGRELSGTSGLVEWFLSQRNGTVSGFTTAVFSGVTTTVLADAILDLIDGHPGLSGLYHLGGASIDKAHLLRLLNEAYGARVAITPSAELRIDRSLDASRLGAATGFVAPSWEAMIGTLAADTTPYEEWRARHADA
jgi:dTDP-4-dehydrorhamnose reductase